MSETTERCLIIDNCQVEIDRFRGVLYIHHPDGYTILRVCGLPTPVPAPGFGRMLDITLKFTGKL